MKNPRLTDRITALQHDLHTPTTAPTQREITTAFLTKIAADLKRNLHVLPEVGEDTAVIAILQGQTFRAPMVLLAKDQTLIPLTREDIKLILTALNKHKQES
jgi:hypothetical protein